MADMLLKECSKILTINIILLWVRGLPFYSSQWNKEIIQPPLVKEIQDEKIKRSVCSSTKVNSFGIFERKN
ncbi:hypothetical protein LMG8526HA_02420 [Lactococcus lactis]|uniref:hypothetical protein n=1 Tax=Lactococcus lactis TaxID=1358 RepID=UPI0028FD3DA0|nr:hypothetical protein [Lactococcus lactis]MDU0401521.1 hypothetical protein [Lactococcus lactis]